MNELASLLTAREFDCQYEWTAHQPQAEKEGIPDEVIAAIRDRKPPQGLPPDEALVVEYSLELLRNHRVSEGTFNAALTVLGVQGLIDLTATIGYYSMLASGPERFEVAPVGEPLLPVSSPRQRTHLALLLDRSTIQSLLTMEDTLQIMEQAFVQLAEHAVDMPKRLTMSDAQRAGWTALMPARLLESGAFGIKVVTTFDENPSKYGVPTIMGAILYHGPRNRAGAFRNGRRLYHRNAHRRSVRAGYQIHGAAGRIDGGYSGRRVQARTQLEAICAVRRIDSVLCYSSGNAERQKSFVEDMSRLIDVSVMVAGSAQEVVEASDVLALATTSQSPVLEGRWLRPGTHINGVGAHKPDARELDTESIIRSKVVCDYVPSCLAETGTSSSQSRKEPSMAI